MKLTNERIEQVVDYYQNLVPDYRVSRMIFGNIVDNNTEDNYFKDKDTGARVVNTYNILFRKGNEILSLEMAIERFNLPELEKVLLQI